jgi:hypothetical protein
MMDLTTNGVQEGWDLGLSSSGVFTDLFQHSIASTK